MNKDLAKRNIFIDHMFLFKFHDFNYIGYKCCVHWGFEVIFISIWYYVMACNIL